MKTFGITGGIGMGKSTAAQILRKRGVPVIDADDLARQIVQPGEPALGEILQTFGSDLVDAVGQLDRAALARIIFPDPAARAKLEAILHPRITALWKAQLQSWQDEGRAMAVVVIPLLFETGVEAEFDAVICVACSAPAQQQRLAARDWSSGQIQQRIGAQMPIAEKMLRSRFVVWTEGEIDVTAGQLAKIIPT